MWGWCLHLRAPVLNSEMFLGAGSISWIKQKRPTVATVRLPSGFAGQGRWAGEERHLQGTPGVKPGGSDPTVLRDPGSLEC